MPPSIRLPTPRCVLRNQPSIRHHRLPQPTTPTQQHPHPSSPLLLLRSTRRSYSQGAPPPAPPSNKRSPRPPADLAALDVLGAAPPPATVVDVCLPDGFVVGDGAVTIDGGSGALLVGGEAFAWRPWEGGEARGGGGGGGPRLVDGTGRWHVGEEAFGLLGVVWPRPDLLIIGLGPDMRPLSPAVRKHISSLGIRVEVADTRNAAAQFNLLATERGVDQVAAALIPIGWREGVGAV